MFLSGTCLGYTSLAIQHCTILHPAQQHSVLHHAASFIQSLGFFFAAVVARSGALSGTAWPPKCVLWVRCRRPAPARQGESGSKPKARMLEVKRTKCAKAKQPVIGLPCSGQKSWMGVCRAQAAALICNRKGQLAALNLNQGC